MGTALDFDVRLLQPAALAGIYGLSSIVMVVCLLPAIVGYADRGRVLSRAVAVGLGAVLVVALTGGYGVWRLGTVEALSDRPAPMIRLVQPNISQELKGQPELQFSQIATQIVESRLQNGTVPRVVVWPETAIPYQFFRDPEIRRQLAAAVPPGGLLIAGAVRGERDADGQSSFFNSLVALDDAGEVVAVYDKQHLVPFGEYVPLRGILPIDKLTPGTTDFTPGPGPRTVDLPGLPPFSPLICYEAIFPAESVDPDVRPAWLLNITNDAWFGTSSGPYQHLASARLRAVEQGLPLLRAANTGISAVIDAQGRYIARLGLNQLGVIDAALPPPMSPTIYSRWGNWTLLLIVSPALIYLAWSLRRLPPRGDRAASAATGTS